VAKKYRILGVFSVITVHVGKGRKKEERDTAFFYLFPVIAKTFFGKTGFLPLWTFSIRYF
jgi:nitrate reductase NapE component